MGRRRIIRTLEALQRDVTAWQRHHRLQMAALEQQMTAIERSVAQVETDAHGAAVTMGSIEHELLNRVEQVEQSIEIQTLRRQGRIPAEDVTDCRGPRQ